MYDSTDPRSGLSAPASTPAADAQFDRCEIGRFDMEPPTETDSTGLTWHIRGQNFVVAYTQADAGAILARPNQLDEYAVLAPDAGTGLEVVWGGVTTKIAGGSLVFIPPGDSRIHLPSGGAVTRLFTSMAADMVALCRNAGAYASPHARVTPVTPWPMPVGGWKVRAYKLDVPSLPGRFGRIWRCSTFMINFLDPRTGPRDVTKLSPHSHEDFEQCSLALEGEFVHHLRWPWTTNLNHWRPDQHEACGSPSVIIIPPPAIHTTQAVGQGTNQLVDIFCPPRLDFSAKPGWVLNEDDYPAATGTTS